MKLATRDLAVQQRQARLAHELLAVITNPTIAYGLMLIGIYGLLLEGYNPGACCPGVVGAICLLIALFAFQILSVNYAGLALVALGRRDDRRRVLLSRLSARSGWVASLPSWSDRSSCSTRMCRA